MYKISDGTVGSYGWHDHLEFLEVKFDSIPMESICILLLHAFQCFMDTWHGS